VIEVAVAGLFAPAGRKTRCSADFWYLPGARLDWLLCARAEWRRRKRLYLRHSVRRKKGRSHTYWRLVRSVRLLTWSREMQTRVTFMGAASMNTRTRWHRSPIRRPCVVRFAPEYAISVQLIGEYDRQNDNDPN
jgi:hypothetical protein